MCAHSGTILHDSLNTVILTYKHTCSHFSLLFTKVGPPAPRPDSVAGARVVHCVTGPVTARPRPRASTAYTNSCRPIYIPAIMIADGSAKQSEAARPEAQLSRSCELGRRTVKETVVKSRPAVALCVACS